MRWFGERGESKAPSGKVISDRSHFSTTAKVLPFLSSTRHSGRHRSRSHPRRMGGFRTLMLIVASLGFLVCWRRISKDPLLTPHIVAVIRIQDFISSIFPYVAWNVKARPRRRTKEEAQTTRMKTTSMFEMLPGSRCGQVRDVVKFEM